LYVIRLRYVVPYHNPDEPEPYRVKPSGAGLHTKRLHLGKRQAFYQAVPDPTGDDFSAVSNDRSQEEYIRGSSAESVGKQTVGRYGCGW